MLSITCKEKKKLSKEQLKLIKKNKISFKKINLTKPIKLKNNFDIIYNFAAILGVRNVTKKPYITLTQNIEITKNLIDFCKKKKNCKFINFSSSEVYSNLIFKKLIKYPTIENLDLNSISNSISNSRVDFGIYLFFSPFLILTNDFS